MRHLLARVLGTTVTALLSCAAYAVNYSDQPVHVASLTPIYMGSPTGNGVVLFRIDQNLGNCVASNGTHYFFYTPVVPASSPTDAKIDNERQMTNAKAVFSTLQMALASGNIVKLTGNNGVYDSQSGNTFCQVFDIKLTNTY